MEEQELEATHEQSDEQSLKEIEVFFDMACKLEETTFNLYPNQRQEMQLLLINLVLQRLEWFNYE